MLAEESGLLAAKANQLPICHRLKSIGKNFVHQQCLAMNVTFSAKETKWGMEPIYATYTIGKDGYSLYPFRECFWVNGFINFNDRTFTWRNGSFIPVEASSHLSSYKIRAHIEELDDKEYLYQIHHEFLHTEPEIEEANVRAELLSSLQGNQADSLVQMTRAVAEENRFASWIHVPGIVKTLVVSSFIFISGFVLLCLVTIYGGRK